tara:strand:+ start:364 stop:585 length:222 start_codon:yes stop_codon:yes gene_type:complete
MAAITEIKTINCKKSRLTSSKPAQAKAPSARRYSLIAQLAGAVIDNTNITAKPRPIEVSTFLDIDKNEHIPKK